MTTLLTGMLIFYGIHLVSLTPLKPKLKSALGEKPYKGLYSLVALAGLGIMIWGFGMARSGPDAARIVFNPPGWSFYVTAVFTFIALVLIGASHGKGNIKKVTKNPMSLGVAFWALGHLFSNGNLSEVWFFGGFLAYAVLDIIVSTVRGNTLSYTTRLKSDIIALIVAAVLFVIILYFHHFLFGVSVL